MAAAGGWRDTTTLLRYQQPDEATLRRVVEFERPDGRSGASQSAGAEHAHLHAHPRK